jgi:hypothetical protein
VGIVMAVALASVLAGIVYITGAGTGKW